MSLKQNFVERASKGETVAALCREFGISRQTGHKWIRRFAESGYDGLEERSRRPASTPLATAEDIVVAVLQARNKHPTWGPRKLVVVLARRFGEQAPSERTIARILRRAELVRVRRKRRPSNLVERAPTVQAVVPNDVWTMDFKGWWLTRDGRRANPLTVRDAFSRYILAVRLCPQTTDAVMEVLAALFKKHGAPNAVQCDNGTPFVSVRSAAGLSKVSAWLVSLGIDVVRSRVGSPQDNGGHERMHLDMSRELEVLPAENVAAQQRAIDRWRQTFNHVRPHDALGRKTPADLYVPKTRRTAALRGFVYPAGTEVRRVVGNGNVRFDGASYFVSSALAGLWVGIERVSATKAQIWFYEIDLGTIDIEPVTDLAVYTRAIEMSERGKKGAA